MTDYFSRSPVLKANQSARKPPFLPLFLNVFVPLPSLYSSFLQWGLRVRSDSIMSPVWPLHHSQWGTQCTGM